LIWINPMLGKFAHSVSWIVSVSAHSKPLMLEVVLAKRGRSRWEWRVCDSSGRTIMGGWENSRQAAKYRGDRALFMLLAAVGKAFDPPQTPQGPQPAR
jgi:hypothetical protein